MRPRVPWMTSADNQILEFLDETDILATPHVISANIDYSQQYVNERVRILVRNDLLEQTEGALYRITGQGQAYLNGELDVEDLPPEHEE